MSTAPFFARSEGCYSREVEGEIFLIAPESEAIFYLDPIGAALWRVLERPQRLDDIVPLFADAFPDQAWETLHGDLTRLLRELEEAGFVTRQAG